jgi:hypothetical protein
MCLASRNNLSNGAKIELIVPDFFKELTCMKIEEKKSRVLPVFPRDFVHVLVEATEGLFFLAVFL